MEEVGVRMRFEGDNLRLDEQLIELEWKPTWRKVKTALKKGLECRRIKMYKAKQQQSKLFSDQEEECHMWLSQNLHPRKTSAIMNMLEQMVETRSWKAVRGLVEDGRCRVCNEQSETVKHLIAGCKVLANSEYLSRHNRALMILAVEWAKEYDLIGMEQCGTKNGGSEEQSFRMEKQNWSGILNFIFEKRRPDLILKEKGEKHIWICDMACPQQHNLETKRAEKLTKYQQLAFEMRERGP